MRPFNPKRTSSGPKTLKTPERLILPAAALLAVTLLAYLPVLNAAFIWDDDVFVTQNPLVRAPDGLYRFWFTTQAPDYFPLTSSMMWVEWRLWGMDAAGYHAVNLLLHAAAVILIWRALARLKLPGAWLAALIFAVHPVNVESVAWIAEGKNTLSLLFCAASLLAYLKFDGTDRSDGSDRSDGCEVNVPGRQFAIFNSKFSIYALSLFLFLLALLAKTSVVMLPAVLLLCAWWRRRKIGFRDLRRAAPFFLLSALLGLATVWFQYHRGMGPEPSRSDGLLTRTACAGWAAWFYLYKALLPAGLCFVYPRWQTSAAAAAFVPALLLAAALLIFWRRRGGWGRSLFFGAGCYLAMLAPVLGFLNIAFMRYSLAADHWQYAALAAVAALAGGGIARAASAKGAKGTLWFAAGAALVALLAFATARQARIYRDEETLWRATLRENPRAALACNNLAATLILRCERENPPDAQKLYAEANGLVERALRLAPGSADAYFNLAMSDSGLGRLEDACRDYTAALQLRKDYLEAYCNRGNVLFRLGRYDLAAEDYTSAIGLGQDSAMLYGNRAAAYYQLKEYDKSLKDLRQAEKRGGQVDPEFVKALEQKTGRAE